MNINPRKCLLAALCFLLLAAPLPAAGGGITDDQEIHKKDNPWDPGPGRVIYDGTYPPPQAYPPPYHYPAQPGYAPYYCPSPYYQPPVPWYERELPASAGRVAVLVDPVQAEVFIDGYPLKRQNDLAYEAGLLPGEYKVEIRAKGFEPHSQEVQVRGGERVRLDIRLQPLKSGKK